MNDVLARLAVFITGVIAAMGYPGIALLMALGSACVPLPSEIVMPFAGYLVSQGTFSLVGAASAGAIGCTLGSIIAYGVGRRGGRPLIERYGRYVLLDRHDLDKAERFFARCGSGAVLIGQMVPVIRSFVAFPAGVARMPFVKFVCYAIAGSWPWCFLLAWVGMKLGQRWDSDPRVKAAFHSLDVMIVVLALAAVAWFVWRKLKRKA